MLSARWWTLVVWALAAAGALFWGLKLFVKAPPAPPNTQLAGASGPPRGDPARLLGADAPPPTAAVAVEPGPDARFQLLGVVSPRSPQAQHEGVALIAVDGKPPRAYRVGTTIDGQNILQSVNARGVTLGPRDGPALVALNLAPPAPPATGVPAPAVSDIPGAAMPAFPGARFTPPPRQAMPPVRSSPSFAPPPPAPALPNRMPGQPAPVAVDPTPPQGVLPSPPVDATQQR